MDSEVERYTASTPRSAELQAEAERYLPGGSSRGTAYFGPYPFFVERTEGHHIVDVDGNRYLDFMLNATTYVLGHSNDRVVEAVQGTGAGRSELQHAARIASAAGAGAVRASAVG